ncbi:MAG TPA: hypothetical protein VGS96_01315 [Thermoanaerobaculia bacterium]|nr:hypothetical protein [Thermoanaerobaculia bacterium]
MRTVLMGGLSPCADNPKMAKVNIQLAAHGPQKVFLECIQKAT